MRRCTGFRPSRASGSARLHDHAHGVIEIGSFQLVFDRDGRDRIAALSGGAEFDVGIVAQNRSSEAPGRGAKTGAIPSISATRKPANYARYNRLI